MPTAPVVPILFLDIDGVLNTTRTWGAWTHLGRHEALEPVLVTRVAALVERTGARVVLSSMWRRSTVGLTGTVLALEYQGWRNCRRQLRDETPFLGGMPRGDEIALWLRNAEHKGAIAVLDDEADMGSVLPFLVQTDREVGVTDADIVRVERLLLTR